MALKQSYKWDQDSSVAEWLEQQLEGGGCREGDPSPTSRAGVTSHLLESLQMFKRDAALSSVKSVLEVQRDVILANF